MKKIKHNSLFMLVLPKFEVKIAANKYASKGDGDVRGTVSAK